MFSMSIATIIMFFSIHAAPAAPVVVEYGHRAVADHDLDRTDWLPEVVVTAELIKGPVPGPARFASADGWSENTYWLPEVVVTAEPIDDREPVTASAPVPPAVNRFASAVVAAALVLFSALLGFGLLARPQAVPCPRLQPVTSKRLKPNRRRSSGRRG